MKIIQTLTLAALAVAFTASASAFPYTQPTYTVIAHPATQPLASIKGGGLQGGASTERTTIAVYPQRSKAAAPKAHNAGQANR